MALADAAPSRVTFFSWPDSSGLDSLTNDPQYDPAPFGYWQPYAPLSTIDHDDNDLNMYFKREATDSNTFDMAPGSVLHAALRITVDGDVFELPATPLDFASKQDCPEGKERLPSREAQGGECVD